MTSASARASTTTVVTAGEPREDAEERGSGYNGQFGAELYPGPGEKTKHPFLVEFEPNDPMNPQNWSRKYRWYLTMSAGLITVNSTFSSSAPSGIAMQLIEEFHMSTEIATLTIALFVAGYCVGPLLWAPLSENYGRRPIFVGCFFIYTCFLVGCALSKNVASLLIFRILGGIFAAAPLTNSGAVISDMWDAGTRGKAIALFTVAPIAGPALGPTVSGYISTAGVSWRWLFWVLTIFAGACWVLILFTLPETYAPIIMVQKAKAMRKKTGDDRYFAPLEAEEKMSFLKRVEAIVARPFKILFQEPMLIAITVYISFVYGCLYLLFEAYPVVFTEGHHLSPGASGLMFLPVFCGGLLAVASYLAYFNPSYERAMVEYAPHPVPPEFRLRLAIVGSPVFAISFFWFGWTSYPSISFWAPMMSGIAMGFSSVLIFLALLNYTIDAYLFVAASALASNAVVRSAAGAGFPLFATQMYNALNPRWASTLLGCVAVLMIPIPSVLIKFGPKLRQHSKHAPTRPTPLKVETSEA